MKTIGDVTRYLDMSSGRSRCCNVVLTLFRLWRGVLTEVTQPDDEMETIIHHICLTKWEQTRSVLMPSGEPLSQ